MIKGARNKGPSTIPQISKHFFGLANSNAEYSFLNFSTLCSCCTYKKKRVHWTNHPQHILTHTRQNSGHAYQGSRENFSPSSPPGSSPLQSATAHALQLRPGSLREHGSASVISMQCRLFLYQRYFGNGWWTEWRGLVFWGKIRGWTRKPKLLPLQRGNIAPRIEFEAKPLFTKWWDSAVNSLWKQGVEKAENESNAVLRGRWAKFPGMPISFFHLAATRTWRLTHCARTNFGENSIISTILSN